MKSDVYVAVSGWSTNPNVNWRVFNVFCAAPYFILFPLRIIFWRHESPYIVQKRSYAKALILLHKMDVDKKISKFSLASQDTVQHRTNLAWKLTICASVIFFLQSFAYYGLTFTLQALAKDLEIKNLDIFINFIGIATSQIPGLIFSSLIIDRLGRRPLLCIGLLGSAVSSASLIAIAKDRTLFTTATSVVYMFIVMSWTSIYIGFPELFPASSRARSFSIASVFGKVAGLLAPHFFHSSLGAHATLGSVIASFAVSSLIVISMMPETADKLLS